MNWFKSSYSADSANCVEVAWRRSTRCESNSCVEVAQLDAVLVRDSKDPAGPRLRFDPGHWAEFIDGVKAGEFDA